jgi:hypothetical protein
MLMITRLPIEDLAAVDDAIKVGNAEKEVAIERALLEENSPYPEVNAYSLCCSLCCRRLLSGSVR